MSIVRVDDKHPNGLKVASGTYTPTAAGITDEIYCGFRPKKIFLYSNGASGTASSAASGAMRVIYDADLYPSNFMRGFKASSTYLDSPAVIPGSTSETGFNEITNAGFKVYFGSSTVNTMYYWVAVSR